MKYRMVVFAKIANVESIDEKCGFLSFMMVFYA